MKIIAHRRNSIAELEATPAEFGVEVDIRSFGTKLIVNHEPFFDSVSFEDWLEHFHHKTLILNIKEEGIENRVAELVSRRGIADYFFLDLSFPFLVKLARNGERRIAVRFSEYETIETALTMAGLVDWVWVDCFSQMPLTARAHQMLKAHFKLCLVSPELQGRSVSEIKGYRSMLNGLPIDAVCTKRPDLWIV